MEITEHLTTTFIISDDNRFRQVLNFENTENVTLWFISSFYITVSLGRLYFYVDELLLLLLFAYENTGH